VISFFVLGFGFEIFQKVGCSKEQKSVDAPASAGID
jgi:hypothetical protein